MRSMVVGHACVFWSKNLAERHVSLQQYYTAVDETIQLLSAPLLLVYGRTIHKAYTRCTSYTAVQPSIAGCG